MKYCYCDSGRQPQRHKLLEPEDHKITEELHVHMETPFPSRYEVWLKEEYRTDWGEGSHPLDTLAPHWGCHPCCWGRGTSIHGILLPHIQDAPHLRSACLQGMCLYVLECVLNVCLTYIQMCISAVKSVVCLRGQAGAGMARKSERPGDRGAKTIKTLWLSLFFFLKPMWCVVFLKLPDVVRI